MHHGERARDTDANVYAVDVCKRSKDPTLLKQLSAVLLAILAGVCLVVQNGVNTNLRKHAVTASFPAACTSFSVGLVTICLVAFAHSPRCGETTMRSAPWYAFTGGVLGPVYIVCAILLSSRLGFAVFQLCAISGQLLSSLICDAVGLLYLTKKPATCGRIIAVGFTLAGAIFTSSGVEFKDEGWKVLLFSAAAFAAGMVFPVQACVNAVMKTHVLTPFRAVAVSFAGGALILFSISVFLEITQQQQLRIQSGEIWMWTGGILGGTLVTCNVVGVSIIGAAAYTVISLASQLATAFVLDLIGAFGFTAIAFSFRRALGVGLAIAAAVFFQMQTAVRDTSEKVTAHDVQQMSNGEGDVGDVKEDVGTSTVTSI